MPGRDPVILIPTGPHPWGAFWHISPPLISALKQLPATLIELSAFSTETDSRVLSRIHPDRCAAWILPYGSLSLGGMRLAHRLETALGGNRPPLWIIFNGEGSKGCLQLVAVSSFLRKTDRFVTTCRSEARLLEAALAPGTCAHVTALPVNRAIFKPMSSGGRAQFKVGLGMKARDPLLVCAGRISHQKNVHLLLEAFAVLLRKSPRSRLIILGEVDQLGYPHLGVTLRENYAVTLARLLAKLDLADHVRFEGSVSQPTLARYLGACDLQLSLTTHFGEDFGYAIAQGISAGAPTLITRWGGGHEFVEGRGARGLEVVIEAGFPTVNPLKAAHAIAKALAPGENARLRRSAQSFARVSLQVSSPTDSWLSKWRSFSGARDLTKGNLTPTPAARRFYESNRKASLAVKAGRPLFAGPKDRRYLEILRQYIKPSGVSAWVALGLGLALHGNAAAAPNAPDARFEEALLIGCSSESAEHTVQVSGTVILNKKFISSSTTGSAESKPKTESPAGGEGKEELIHAAIRQQLRYLAGYFQNDSEHHGGTRVARGAYEAPIRITRQVETSYPLNLTIDAYREPSPNTIPYVHAAMKGGSTSTQDPAVEVSYTSELKLVVCGLGRAEAPVPKLAWVPKDPFLAMWNVKPSQRRPQRYGRSFKLTSPCATPEMADFGNSLDYWYVWSPRIRGVDEEGHDYDCQKQNPLVEYATPIQLSLISSTPSLSKTTPVIDRSTTAPLRMTSIFGQLSTVGFRKLDFPGFAKRMRAAEHAWNDFGEKIWREDLDPRKRETLYEPGAMEMLSFLRNAKHVIDIKRARVNLVNPNYIEFTLSGKLSHSGHAIEVTVGYGNTSIFEIPQHWRSLLNGFEKDDLVVYNGHAGLGGNVRLENLRKALKISEASLQRSMTRKPRQMVALFNCYSYTLFGEDILKYRDPTSTTDLVLSGTKDAGAKYALALIRLFDRSFTGESVDLPGAFSRYVGPYDFAVYKRVSRLEKRGSRQAMK